MLQITKTNRTAGAKDMLVILADPAQLRSIEVIAINRAAQEVPASELSQGTTEQLYLCMRFALAESFS